MRKLSFFLLPNYFILYFFKKYILLFQAGQHLAHQLEVGASGSDLCAFLRMSRSTASQSMHNSSTTSLQYLALQEELSDAKERNVQLAARLQQKEADLDEARKDLEEVAKEKEQLREKVTQLEEKILMAPAMSPVRRKHESGSDFKKVCTYYICTSTYYILPTYHTFK